MIMADDTNNLLPDWIYHILYDEVYNSIRTVTKSGPGRPKVFDLCPTAKLLLQLYLIRLEHNLSWSELSTLAVKHQLLVPPHNHTIRALIEAEVKRASFHTEESLLQPLAIFEVGPRLQAVGITSVDLEKCLTCPFKKGPITVSNGMALELEKFSSTMKECSIFIEKLTGISISEQELRKKFKTLKKTKESLRNRKKLNEMEELLETKFLSETAHQVTVPPVSVATASCPTASDKSPEPACASITDADLTVQNKHIAALQLPAVRREMQHLKEQLKFQDEEKATLTSIIHDLRQEKSDLERDISTAKQQLVTKEEKAVILKRKTRSLEKTLKLKSAELSAVRQSSFYKRLKRKERELSNMKCKDCATSKHLITNVQKHNSKLKQKIQSLQTKVASAEDHATILTEALNSDYSTPQLLTRDGNQFTKPVVKCVVALISEEIPSNRCGKVIQIVSNTLFNQSLSDKDVPSSRTSLRFADMGHCIAKMQLSDIVSNERFDLHTDGTSKDHTKYVSQQVTTSKGLTYSCGFRTVHCENAMNLLEGTLDLLQELSEISCTAATGETSEILKSILRNLSASMSDRAAVMKSFAKDLNSTRKQKIETDEDLEILHCNAHFLLGLSAAAEKVLKQLESEEEMKLGRDKNSRFARFKHSSEAATVRFIRLACSILAPRGDEKNGCRDSWEAFCSLTGVNCPLQSFRANRFNNHFDAAEVLLAARPHIISFLQDYVPTRNEKLQSVLEDALDDNLMKFICAMGFINIYISKPFWNLVRCDSVSYGNFYRYVVELWRKLQAWSDDASTMNTPASQPLFADIMKPPVSRIDLNVDPAVFRIVQQLCRAFAEVTERQLSDFLPGGKYHDVQDPDRLARLQNSKLTNLVGEQCFGDLDFSLFKRRNASTHHHSTIHMLKRNAVSQWLDSKSTTEQNDIINCAAQKAPALRLKHKAEEEEERVKQQQFLAAQKKERRKMEEKTNVLDTVTKNGGPCKSPAEVDVLVTCLGNQKERIKALRAQIKYHKIVVGNTSNFLKLSGGLNQMILNLKRFLGDPEPTVPSFSRKRTLYVSSASSETSSSSDKAEDPDTALKVAVKDFKFTIQGETVAVFYTNDFYIGQVTHILSADKAEVKFMEKCSLGKPVYRWPSKEDTDTVESKYVFASGFDLHTSNGRLWTCADEENVKCQFKLYCELYC